MRTIDMQFASRSPRTARRPGIVLAAALGLAFATAGSPAPSLAQGREAPPTFAPIVKELLPAVVNISTTQEVATAPEFGQGPGLPVPEGSPLEDFFREFFGNRLPEARPRNLTALGSGFIIDPSGVVVTNNHVVAEATSIQVVLQDDRTFDAEVVGTDPATDIAVLKIETDESLPAVEWGDSETLEVGDWMIAIGNPFGLGGSVTVGVLSAHARDIRAGPYDNFLQTDASINRGNSGGPLFSSDGKVVGVNTVILSPSGGNIGIGFAVPSSMAQPVVRQLLATGKVTRGFIGVTIQPVTDDIATALGLDRARGALVAEVHADSPAVDAGFAAGDVILRFAGNAVDQVRDLPRIVAATEVGKTVDVRVWRDGQEETLQVKVGERPAEQSRAMQDRGGEQQPARYGMTLAPLTPETKASLGIDDDAIKGGAVVTGVASGSPADDRDIRTGDVIVEVNRKPVSGPDDVVREIESAGESGRKNVLLRIYRDGGYAFVALPTEPGEDDTSGGDRG